MQVTFTGWKAELEACESKLSAAQAEIERLKKALDTALLGCRIKESLTGDLQNFAHRAEQAEDRLAEAQEANAALRGQLSDAKKLEGALKAQLAEAVEMIKRLSREYNYDPSTGETTGKTLGAKMADEFLAKIKGTEKP